MILKHLNRPAYWQGTRANPESLAYLSLGTRGESTTLLYTPGGVSDEPGARRLAACWNACHGLDIPEGVPPGAVAELVARLRRVLSFGVTCTSGLDDEEFFPALDELLDTLDTIVPPTS